MTKIQFVLILLFYKAISIAQLSIDEINQFKAYEDSLKKIQLRMFHSKKESNRFAANKDFIALFNKVLENEKSLSFPFDSLKEISRLTSPDKKFRIITWNMLKEDETHVFFGFLQVNNTKTIKKGLFKKEISNQYEFFPLLDKSMGVNNPELYVGEPSKWFGMLYYEIIKSDDDFYTLFGWDGNNKITQRKFIDVLYFKPDGKPVFGKDVFKIPGKFAKRLMFEYASEVAMSIKYNSSRKQIIYSHLAPNTDDPTLQNQYQYYGPDGSYDALYMKKGHWNYEPAIDIRKEKDKNDNANKPNPNNQKPVYKPK